MHQETIDRLLTINQEFYQSFAEPFSETRGRVQPGVVRTIQNVPERASVLDIGCGNGMLACTLFELGHKGTYVGVDSISKFLRIARENCAHPNVIFLNRDITTSNWELDLPAPFNRIFAFAILHHLPGRALREGVLGTFHDLLHPDGKLIFSLWNFMASSRLRGRIIPWERIGLDPDDLDPGDTLLDWRRGGVGLRYVHVFEPEELIQLAENTGFKVREHYYSDGEGGKLGYYQVWQTAENPDL
jgi:tRNA (uracil-5-)-methyltransferase TRM9